MHQYRGAIYAIFDLIGQKLGVVANEPGNADMPPCDH